MRKAQIFTAQNGTQFYVRCIEKGEAYGYGARWGTWGSARDGAPGVIFYDFDYAHRNGFGGEGQQVSTYYLETILDHPMDAGLDLDSGIEKWTIDAGTMADIIDFLEEYEFERTGAIK